MDSAVNSYLLSLGVSQAIFELADDLDLVFPSEDLKRRQRKPFFCELYKAEMKERKRMRDILCRELAKRNKKYSRYVHASYHPY